MIDVSQQINAVRRKVGTRVLEAGQARVVTLSQVYETDIDDLWDACTNPARIPRWFLPISGDLRLGGRYQLEGNAGGTIEACDPPRGFTATWEFDGRGITWIELRLTSEGEGRTRFELDHVGHIDDDLWAEFGPGAVGIGWDLGLVGLALHVASGAAVDHAEAEAWTGSPDGKDFMTRSNDAWCEANVVAGANPADARAAADRTIAAYTGAESAPDGAGGTV
jgi:uncharacterized protein YndB with AHSA1/START domain